MIRRGRYQGIDERARRLVRFDRYHAQRLRAGVKAATTFHEISEAQLGIFRALLPMPAPASWLAWRLGLDASYLWRTLRLMEFEEERAREFLLQLPLRQQERLVEAMETLIEIFGRDDLTNLLERTCEA